MLALEIDPAAFLPADDSSYGFDNVSSGLGVSPALVRRLTIDLIGMLEAAVAGAGYSDEPDGVRLMVLANATVLACMCEEDGAVAVDDINATLAAHGSRYRLVQTN